MDQSQSEPDAGGGRPGYGLVVAAALLALIALIVSGYLSVQTLTGQAIAGCGADDGCGSVLASPWSQVAGLPLSLLGMATYLVVLVGLGLRLGSKGASKLGDFLLLASAPAMLIAAVWFTYIQLVEIQAICPYCMVDHGVGVVLAIVLPILVLGSTPLKPAWPIAFGAMGAVAMIGLQHITLAEDTQSTANPFVDRDGDKIIDGQRHVSMFGGEVQFVLDDTPHIGDDRAKHVIGLVFDYACPECRATHMLLEETSEADPDRVVVVPLPISIDEQHNPHINSDNERFDDSYELATLAQAVASVDMDKWRTFDRWLFSPKTDADFPRSAKAARVKAADLIGDATLSGMMSKDHLLSHQATIDRNIQAMAVLPLDRRYVPIVTSPGAPRHLTGRIYQRDAIDKLLDQAAEGLEAINREMDEASP